MNAAIVRSVTINGNGHTVILGNPITINQANTVVALRGLVLDGQRTTLRGIHITAGASVHIEGCVIQDFTADGIRAAAAGFELFVLDSISRNNGGAGLITFDAGASSKMTIDNSHFDNNGAGVFFEGGRATIGRSTASGNIEGITAFGNSSVSVMSTTAGQNFGNGFFARAGSAMTVESSSAHGNGSGLAVESGGTARISNSTIATNTTGINNAGTVETRQNNTVRGNTTNVVGALTPVGGT